MKNYAWKMIFFIKENRFRRIVFHFRRVESDKSSKECDKKYESLADAEIFFF